VFEAWVDNLHTPRKVTPKGLPSCRNLSLSMLLTAVADLESSSFAIDVLSLNSCVIAIPIDANESDVRNHARKVRSLATVSPEISAFGRKVATYRVQDDRVQHCPCSQARRYRTSRQAVSSSVLCPSHPQTLDQYQHYPV
jgi:hypothetical protein